MSLSEFKKIRHHQMPGDIPKKEKIEMLENPSSPRAKSFVKMLKMRARAVLKEKTRREVRTQRGE